MIREIRAIRGKNDFSLSCASFELTNSSDEHYFLALA